jgi:hypothetical protein
MTEYNAADALRDILEEVAVSDMLVAAREQNGTTSEKTPEQITASVLSKVGTRTVELIALEAVRAGLAVAHAKAQELHLLLGSAIETGFMSEGTKEDMERALEIAAVIVSDTDPEGEQN